MQSRRPCNFYAQGRCFKGDRCDFGHDGPAPPRHNNNNPRSFRTSRNEAPPQNNQSKRTCRFYAQGNCTKGDQCLFSHSSMDESMHSQPQQHQHQQQNARNPRHQKQVQPHQQVQEESYMDGGESSIDAKNQCMQFFTRGDCKNSHCKRSHQASIKDDLQLFGKQRLSEQAGVNDLLDLGQQGLLAVCQDKLVLMDSQYQKIKEEKQEVNQQVTAAGLHQGALCIGVYDQVAKTASISILDLQNGGSHQIQPAHEDWITKLCSWEDKVVSGSLDGKIKVWEQSNGTFQLASCYLHSKKVNVMIQVDRVLMVADQTGGLSVLELGLPQIQLVRHLDMYHHQQVTALRHHGDFLLSGGLDGQVKMISSQNVVQEYSMRGAVSTLSLAKNKKQEDLVCVGYVDGMVELYDGHFSLYGRIPTHHSQRGNNLITLIANRFSNVNEVVSSTLLIADQHGVMSFWAFDLAP